MSHNGKSKRVFIALKLPDNFVEAYEEFIYSKIGKIDELKSVRPENLHFTLKFLGNVDEKIAIDLINALKEPLKDEREIFLSIGKFGFFPSERSPRVVWLGVEKGQSEIKELYSKIEDFAEGFGFQRENRKFVPHLTIGRVKRGRILKKVSFFRDFDFKVLPVENLRLNMVVFYESILKQDGPVYKVLEKYPLNSV